MKKFHRAALKCLFIGVALVGAQLFSPISTKALLLTNSWTNSVSGKWETTTSWSLGTPTISDTAILITNAASKTITIDNATPSGGLTISNLIIQAVGSSTNTLQLTNAISSTLRIVNTLTLNTGASISISNSNLRVDGIGSLVDAYNDGDIVLNGGSLLISNEVAEIGNFARGTLTVSNGTMDIGALEIGENPGSSGTLTLVGGTNSLDGYMLIGAIAGATGTVWISGGRFVTTGSVTRVGNNGVGQMTVSNGAWSAQALQVGGNPSVPGGNGTLTVVAGSVAATGPFLIGSGTGTGTVVVTSFGELVITNQPTAPELGEGFFIVDGSALITNGGSLFVTNGFTFIGEHGSGSFSNAGGIAQFQTMDVGVLSAAGATLTMLGGFTTVNQQLIIGDNVNATGTVWMLGGQYTGPMTVGGTGFGRVAMSNGTMNVNNLILGLSGVGTFTMAGGTNLAQDVNIGFSSATGQLWVTGGQLGGSVVDYSIGIGNVGAMTVSNGVVLGRSMAIGDLPGSQGTLSVNGGSLAFSGPFTVGGGGSTGFVQMTGGQLVLTNTPTLVGVSSGLVVDTSLVISNGGSVSLTTNRAVIGNVGNGTLTNLGGSFTGTNIIVGNLNGSHGSIVMSAGTISAAGTLTLGQNAGSSGSLWLSGGDLALDVSVASLLKLGAAGSGALILSNGTMETMQVLMGTVAGGSGELTIAGGTYTSGSTMTVASVPSSSGTVWITGGVLAQTNPFEGAPIISEDGLAQITVSNGLLLADEVYLGSFSLVGQGTLTAVGGTTIINTNLVLGRSNCSGQGNLVVNGGSVFVTNNTGSAVLDLNHGSLILNSGTLVVDHLVITNSCVSFIKTGGTLILHSPPTLLPDADTDGDGIPNGYEQSHGLDPLDPINATKDSDGDGMTDLQEYLAGTDPTNNASFFGITSIVTIGNDVRVTWMMGSGKTNALQETSGAVGGSYQTNTFTDLFSVTNTVGTITNYLDIGAATNAPARYYRVRLVP